MNGHVPPTSLFPNPHRVARAALALLAGWSIALGAQAQPPAPESNQRQIILQHHAHRQSQRQIILQHHGGRRAQKQIILQKHHH